jgi:hypothetical protein
MVYQHLHESHPEQGIEEVCKVYQPTILKDHVLSAKYHNRSDELFSRQREKKIKNGNNVKPFITWQGFFNRIFSSLDMLSVKMQRLTAGKTRGFDT